MRRHTQVEEGQCYRKIYGRGGYNSGWQVHSIAVPIEAMPHAHLVNIDDPKDVRTVSCATITDRQYFIPMRPPQSGRP